MPVIKIEFVDNLDDQSPFILEWEISQTPSAKIWFKSLKQQLNNDLAILPRFLGFPTTTRDIANLAPKLQSAIDTINKDGRYKIEEDTSSDIDREFLNKVHHHFEVLSGPGQESTKFFDESTPRVKIAVENLNYYVHEMESYIASTMTKEEYKEYNYSAICVDFLSQKKIYSIPSFCDEDFTLDTQFGDIVLHYCQKGKTLWEVFLDGDEEIFKQNILELRYIDGSFDMIFAKIGNLEEKKKEFAKFLEDNSFDINDKKLRIGFNVVAKLKTPYQSIAQVQEMLGSKCGLRTITMSENGNEIASHTFKELFHHDAFEQKHSDPSYYARSTRRSIT